jgi:hypothetical protein
MKKHQSEQEDPEGGGGEERSLKHRGGPTAVKYIFANISADLNENHVSNGQPVALVWDLILRICDF